MSADMMVFSNSWEFFPCTVNEQPFSIRFDTAVASLDNETRADYPNTLVLSIHANETNDDGFPTAADFERINAIEDNFSSGAYDIRFIGAISGGGYIRFVFCCDNAAQAEAEDVAAALLGGNLQTAVYDFQMLANDDFKYYYTILAPNRYEWQWIMNRKVCDNLEQEGEAFKTPRDIDFYCIFDSEQHIQGVAEKLEAKGFKECSRDKTDDGKYSLSLILAGIPSFEWINGITADILDVLDGTDGIFDGWGSPIEKS